MYQFTPFWDIFLKEIADKTEAWSKPSAPPLATLQRPFYIEKTWF